MTKYHDQRNLFWLTVLRGKIHNGEKNMAAGSHIRKLKGNSSSTPKEQRGCPGSGAKPTTLGAYLQWCSSTTPPKRVHNFPKQQSPLGTKCSHTWVYGVILFIQTTSRGRYEYIPSYICTKNCQNKGGSWHKVESNWLTHLTLTASFSIQHMIFTQAHAHTPRNKKLKVMFCGHSLQHPLFHLWV